MSRVNSHQHAAFVFERESRKTSADSPDIFSTLGAQEMQKGRKKLWWQKSVCFFVPGYGQGLIIRDPSSSAEALD